MIDIVEVEAAREVSVDLVAAFARLLPQLSPSSCAPDADQLAEIMAHPGTTVLVARMDGLVVGLLTLVVFRIPTGLRAWIEDVVVDEAHRGRGVGEALSRAALERAAEQGARTVELTSRPSRQAANRLYLRLGFHPRETNVYRWTGPGPGGGETSTRSAHG